jgi:hypothetical protein
MQAQDPHEIPFAAYLSIERIRPGGRSAMRSFLPIATLIDFLKMEETMSFSARIVASSNANGD